MTSFRVQRQRWYVILNYWNGEHKKALHVILRLQLGIWLLIKCHGRKWSTRSAFLVYLCVFCVYLFVHFCVLAWESYIHLLPFWFHVCSNLYHLPKSSSFGVGYVHHILPTRQWSLSTIVRIVCSFLSSYSNVVFYKFEPQYKRLC